MQKFIPLTIYEVVRTAIAENGKAETATTYHLVEEYAKIAEECDILKSKLGIKQGEAARYRVKFAEEYRARREKIHGLQNEIDFENMVKNGQFQY